jgi:hypothetical protein
MFVLRDPYTLASDTSLGVFPWANCKIYLGLVHVNCLVSHNLFYKVIS